jgi:hypothetical protein
MILLSAVAAAQKPTKPAQSSGTPADGGNVVIDNSPKNKLFFPYGVQSFEKKEKIKIGSEVSVLPGWSFGNNPTMVDAIVTEHPHGASRPGTDSRRWLHIEDLGNGMTEGFTSPILTAPRPWDYSWSFALLVDVAPASDIEAPAYAVQHLTNIDYQDAYGVRLTPTGAELFVTDVWGTTLTSPLFLFSGATDVGQWIDVRLVASLQKRTLTAYVNGDEVTVIRTQPPATTDLTKNRFTYHGGGFGNPSSMLLDDVGVAFLGGGVCTETLSLGFETEDDEELVLVNGQDISTAPEFGNRVDINALAGPNRGAAIFDSDSAGPNDPSQDPDLLVNQGNVLILQNDSGSNPPAVAGIYPRPNDDEHGGAIQFDFHRWLEPLSIDLIDIDLPNQGASIVLTDFFGNTRTYTVPSNWTGDIDQSEPGVGTLDLTDPSPQAGFGSIATAVDVGAYDPLSVVQMVVNFSGSGALDNFEANIECILLAFEVEDDANPGFSGTPMTDGQDLSTPPEFGVEVALSDAGPNDGAAIFESTPGGNNDQLGKPDRDLCVGLGNVLILQNNLAATQTNPGFYDLPNDDTQGGDLIFNYPDTVRINRVDLIDVDEEESFGVTVVLTDNLGNTRQYDVPFGWTEDRLNDGPPGFRTLDLSTLAPQPGYDPPGPPPAQNATGFDTGPFDPNDVVQMVISLGGSQAVDNICFCPQ